MNYIMDNETGRHHTVLPNGYIRIERECWSKGFYRELDRMLKRAYFEQLDYIYLKEENSETFILFPPWKGMGDDNPFYKHQLLTINLLP